MKDKKWDLISLASIPLIMTLGNSMLIPILPEIARELGISSFQVSMLITVYAVMSIILIPVAGYLSDQYGRKKVIIPSLIIAGVGGAVAGLAALFFKEWAYWLILLGRSFQGIGAAGAAPIVMPLVGDMFSDEKEVSSGLGVIETSNTFGKVLSPILGASLGVIVWYLPFLTIPVFCLISILLVAFLVKVPKQEQPKVRMRDFFRSVKDIFKQKGRWLYAIYAIGGICMFIVFGVLFYLSSTLEDKYGVDGVIKGFVLAIPLAALCLSSYFSGKWIGKSKKRMKWVSFLGMVLLTGSIFCVGWLQDIYFMVGGLIFSGIGIGVVLPCLDAMITEGIEKEERGTVSSIYSGMRFIGVSLGPPVVSLLMRTTHMILFFSLAAVCLLGGILCLIAIKPRKEAGEGGPNVILWETRGRAR